MKASNAFKETIKAYLEKRASEDELFAVTYKKENKNLDECCNYVMKCAKEGNCGGYSDDEVFGWAVHYYDEDDIKNIKPISGKVVVNHSVELTEEDKKLAKEKAMELLIEESKSEQKKTLSETIELSEEDKKLAKEKAMELLIEESKSEQKKTLSETIELSEEDLLDAKKQAMQKVVSEQKEKLVAKAAKKKPVTEVEQTDLFG